MYETLAVIFEGWEALVLIGAVAFGHWLGKNTGNLKDEHK